MSSGMTDTSAVRCKRICPAQDKTRRHHENCESAKICEYFVVDLTVTPCYYKKWKLNIANVFEAGSISRPAVKSASYSKIR